MLCEVREFSLLVMRVRVPVLAVLALAELGALHPRTITLAVPFLAHRFLARAPAGGS